MEHSIQDTLWKKQHNRKENLTEFMTMDDSDDPEILEATGMTKKEKEFLQSELKFLRYCDDNLTDAIESGDEYQTKKWAEQYNSCKGLISLYMRRHNIKYRMTKDKDIVKDVAHAKVHKEKKEQDVPHEKKKRIVVKHRSNERGRSLERTKKY